MKTFSVGPDEMNCDDFQVGSEVIYWYMSGSYEGEGVAIEKLADDTFLEWSLGHCSCYGPTERHNKEPIAPDVVFNMVDSIGRERVPGDCDYEMWKAICGAATREWGQVNPRPPEET